MRLPPPGTPEWSALVQRARLLGHGGAPMGSRPEGRAQHLDEIAPVVPMGIPEHGTPAPPEGLPVDWKPQTTTEPIRRFLWGPNQLETVRWGGNVELVRQQGAPSVQTGDILRAEAPYPLVFFPLITCTNRNAANGAPPGVIVDLTVGVGDGVGTVSLNIAPGPFSLNGGFPLPAKWIQMRARSAQPLDPLGDDYTVFCAVGLIY